VQSYKLQLQDSESSGCGLAASALYDPFPRQSPKEKKTKTVAKIYALQYILYAPMNVHVGLKKKKLSQMFKNF
jgi:hypothetical protein